MADGVSIGLQTFEYAKQGVLSIVRHVNHGMTFRQQHVAALRVFPWTSSFTRFLL